MAALLCVAGLCVGIALSTSVQHYCDLNRRGGHAVVNDTAAVSPGYVLVAPYFVTLGLSGDSGELHLIDKRGVVVHSWKFPSPALYAVLRDNGNVVVTLSPKDGPKGGFRIPGSMGTIQELDWEGHVLWTYEDPDMYGPFTLLPDGGMAYLRSERAPASFSQRVIGGFGRTDADAWTQAIVVLDSNRAEKWVWNLPSHLDPAQYPISDFIPKTDWSHTNSIAYTADNPISHTPAFLISVRHASAVLMIDAQTGEVIWRSPEGMFALQHDVSFLDNGNILVFDNGLFREQIGFLHSRVVELDPLTNKLIWQYDGGQGLPAQAQFATSIMGGARRLANGNTLITISTTGRFFEVTKEGKVAWEYANDFKDEKGRQRLVFTAEKYDSAGTEWDTRLSLFARASTLCRR